MKKKKYFIWNRSLFMRALELLRSLCSSLWTVCYTYTHIRLSAAVWICIFSLTFKLLQMVINFWGMLSPGSTYKIQSVHHDLALMTSPLGRLPLLYDQCSPEWLDCLNSYFVLILTKWVS